jgi:hypothetical protein
MPFSSFWFPRIPLQHFKEQRPTLSYLDGKSKPDIQLWRAWDASLFSNLECAITEAAIRRIPLPGRPKNLNRERNLLTPGPLLHKSVEERGMERRARVHAINARNLSGISLPVLRGEAAGLLFMRIRTRTDVPCLAEQHRLGFRASQPHGHQYTKFIRKWLRTTVLVQHRLSDRVLDLGLNRGRVLHLRQETALCAGLVRRPRSDRHVLPHPRCALDECRWRGHHRRDMGLVALRLNLLPRRALPV